MYIYIYIFFLFNIIDGILFYVFMYCQVRAGDNFLMCRHLMTVIILFRFFSFINIGYQLFKVIVVIISCTSNSYITFFNILCSITALYEPITFIKFHIVIIFVTVNLIELVPFSSQIINAASKMLI